MRRLVLLSLIVPLVFADETQQKIADIGPDTCNQDRQTLGKWFMENGMPSLLEDPIPELVRYVESDPYEDPENPPEDPEQIQGFCGMKWSNNTDPSSGLRKYKLSNFKTIEDVGAAGFTVTHQGHCSSCSPLQDLGVFISQNLTMPTRFCGAIGFFSNRAQRECLKKLGFSDMCASIWEYNIKNTRKNCFLTCLWAWLTNMPNNNPDGSLNKCLMCDEDLSGPNFKYFSGRTRRNSGIPSAIYRPPETIYNMTHCYWYGDLV